MSDPVARELSKGGSDGKLSAAQLKGYLKAKGMSQVGDKPSLWGRCQLGHKVTSLGLKTEDGNMPYALKPAELRKAAARAGISPIGTNDELLFALVDHLSKHSKQSSPSSSSSTSSSSTDAGAGGGGGKEKLSPVALAEKVLSMADQSVADPVSILRLADPTVTASSPTAILRKQYLKLSLAIHPDRIGRQFPEATKAFQVLVTAFERLTQPELYEEVEEPGKGKGKAKTAKLSRSNDGCQRTVLCCPRCKEKWTSGGVEGNPEYFYNLMMTGLKSFMCSTCLCSFGCMTAVHKCPHCARPFEYSPQDFHRQVTCGHAACGKPFGFYMYHMSDRVEVELRKEIKASREAHSKVVAAMKRRTEAANRRRGRDEDNEQECAEQAFALGLKDECPRCGLSFLEMVGQSGEDDQREHLMTCSDTNAIASNRAKKGEKAAAQALKEKAATAQADAEALATWHFMGAKPEQLWLLSEDQLQQQCSDKGVDTEPTTQSSDSSKPSKSKSSQSSSSRKEALISALVSSRALVTTSSSSSSAGPTTKRGRFHDADALPSDLHSLPLEELRSVLAGHGFVPNSSTKSGILKEVQAELCKEDDSDDGGDGDDDAYSDGEGGGVSGKGQKKGKGTLRLTSGAAAPSSAGSDDDDDGDDEDGTTSQKKRKGGKNVKSGNSKATKKKRAAVVVDISSDDDSGDSVYDDSD